MADAGDHLIDELLADPQKFNDRGRAYELLQAYFAGLPADTLRPLLAHSQTLVRRAAVFVVSELGAQSRPLIDDIVPLLASGDRYLSYHALEALAVCCDGADAAAFAHVVAALGSEDQVLRNLAMRLVARSRKSQFVGADRALLPAASRAAHDRGLRILASQDVTTPDAVVLMMRDSDPLVRRYGAIIAKRLFDGAEALADEAAASGDADIRKFCDDFPRKRQG